MPMRCRMVTGVTGIACRRPVEIPTFGLMETTPTDGAV